MEAVSDQNAGDCNLFQYNLKNPQRALLYCPVDRGLEVRDLKGQKRENMKL
jgi:hypothetical protein